MHAAFLHMQIFAPIYDFIQHFSYMLNYVGMLTLYEKFFASANICRDVNNKIQRLFEATLLQYFKKHCCRNWQTAEINKLQ